ncbi:MAG: DUF192 domain-containing protein [Longimicrobiales bacterium]|nr:DUF192 domain-containing protein [Longimicrobiales bacterium]
MNQTRGTLLASRSDVAVTWLHRLLGLGRGDPDLGEGLLLVRCNAVHTYGMASRIDVVFVDLHGRVLDVVPEMKPWNRSGRIPGARYALQLPEGTVRASGTSVGDLLSWSPSRHTSLLSQETA